MIWLLMYNICMIYWGLDIAMKANVEMLCVLCIYTLDLGYLDTNAMAVISS